MSQIDLKRLPAIIEKGAETFATDNEKQVFLLSALICFSSIFPNYSGIYFGEIVRSNLYAFIIAPPASGKGAMRSARSLLIPIHLARKVFDFSAVTAAKENQKTKTICHRVLIVPGDISAAALKQVLQCNPDGIIIVETEADVISQALGSDFGAWSDILRKCYHHETVSDMRSTENRHIEIEYPMLSMLITGTPDQVPTLVKSVQDGLFSRFLFLNIEGSDEWQDVFANAKPHSAVMEPLALELKEIHDHAKSMQHHFELSQSQKDLLNHQGAIWLKEALKYGTNAGAIAKRMGLNLFRICMVLSMLRHYEDGLAEETVTCSDDDMALAIELCDGYFGNALMLFEQLSPIKSKNVPDNVQLLYDKLPDKYQKPTDVTIAANAIGLSERTSRNIHNKLKALKLVEQTDTAGVWKKRGAG